MDSFVLTGPAGTAVQLGSWIDWQAGGPNFGEDDLLKAAYAENPAMEGAALAFESVGKRTFTFPLRIPSSAALTLTQAESLLRLSARPGAYIDLQPENTPSSEAVRFNLYTGRLKPHYDPWLNRVSRRDSTLELDVEPFGYWPTMIVLASAASVGLPGFLSVPNASIIGDVPGLGVLDVRPTCPTNYAGGTWLPDFIAWSLSGRRASGFSGFWSGASIQTDFYSASIVGDKFAPASQAFQVASFSPTTAPSWNHLGIVLFTSNIAESAYRGRFRLFAWTQLTPSGGAPWYLSADVTGNVNSALASAAPIATIAQSVATGTPGIWGAQPSPAYTLTDLGEVQMPPQASGLTQTVTARLWVSSATSNSGVAQTIRVGGLYFLPLENAGILSRGIQQATISAPVNDLSPLLEIDAVTDRGPILIDSSGGVADVRALYRGLRPLVGASTTGLDLLGGSRKVASGATSPVIQSAPAFAAVGLSYRPRFTFMKGF